MSGKVNELQGKIVAVCTSANKGERKVDVGTALLLEGLGMEGDATVERCRQRRPGALYNQVFADYLLTGLVRIVTL